MAPRSDAQSARLRPATWASSPSRVAASKRSGMGSAALEFSDQLQALVERDVAVEHAREECAEGQRHLVVDAVGAPDLDGSLHADFRKNGGLMKVPVRRGWEVTIDAIVHELTERDAVCRYPVIPVNAKHHRCIEEIVDPALEAEVIPQPRREACPIWIGSGPDVAPITT